MRDLLYFNEMLTPKFITLVYWILLVFVVLSGLGAVFSGRVFMGLLGIVIGAVSVRIWCELAIVLFKINDNLRRLTESAGPPPAAPGVPPAPQGDQSTPA
ncbi:MAG: DUF4282 domain-containing protein [Pseudomonadota bacterium]|nr:DUF4282 domain-containing protein [Pseudomonadota bacterium]